VIGARGGTISSTWRRHRRSLARFSCNSWARLTWPGAPRRWWSAGRRVIIEKPFGHDLPRTRLERAVLNVFAEHQSIAIDIISAKRRCRTCWCFVLPTACSKPSEPALHRPTCRLTVADTSVFEGRGDYLRHRGNAGIWMQRPHVPVARAGGHGACRTHLLPKAVRDEKSEGAARHSAAEL